MASRTKMDRLAKDSRRREESMAAAARVLAAPDHSSATVRDSADEAGIPSGGPRPLFPPKDAILDQILCGFMNGLLQRSEEVAAQSGGPRHMFGEPTSRAFVMIEKQPGAVILHQHETAFFAALPGCGFVAGKGARIESFCLGAIRDGPALGSHPCGGHLLLLFL